VPDNEVLQDLITERRLRSIWIIRLALSLILLLLGYTLQAQTLIKGTVADSNGKALEGVAVTVVTIESSTTLAYAISAADGSFNLALNPSPDSVKIVARALSYGEQSFIVTNKSQRIDFQLQPQQITLKEVSVRASPITKSNDTISYHVAAFSDKKDRAIADVLRKLPGIEVESSGRILYEGKPIQKFYIEGLDLLEGKYNLASNNLPASAVTSVQVLENHQPVRILDSLVASYSTSLNLKLKNPVTVTGAAEVGAGSGYSPVLWRANLSPMLFTPKQQMLASYQADNTGYDVAAELKTLTIDELRDQAESNTSKQDLLRIREMSPPQFSSNRYLFNNAHLASVNYLLKLRQDVQLRVNASYLNDYQNQEGMTQSVFYFPDDTVRLTEKKHNSLFFNSAQASFSLLKNTKKNYIENILKLSGFRDSQRGSIDLAGRNITQHLHNPYYAVSNKLEAIRPVGRQLVSFSSAIAYSSAPQRLQVSPGQFTELLNNGAAYDELEQQINLAAFYAHHAASITKGIRQWTISPKLGFQVQSQRLESDLGKVQLRDETEPQSLFQNNLQWESRRYYGQLDVGYKAKHWEMTTKLPLSLRNFELQDKPLKRGQDLNRVTFEPNLLLRYDISPLWRAKASVRMTNQFGSIRQMNYAYVLRDYRNLQLNDTPLREGLSKDNSLGLSYNNSLKSLFASLNYSFSTAESNLTFQNVLQENGALIVNALNHPSTALSHSVGLQASKYLSSLGATLGAGTNLYLNQREQILNQRLAIVQNQQLAFNVRASASVTEWLGFDYRSVFSVLKNSIEAGTRSSQVAQQEHHTGINIYPAERNFVGLTAAYYRNNFSQENPTSFFGDLLYRYSFERSGLDLEVKWANIFNVSAFTYSYNDAFMFVQSTYQLRPSQLLLTLRFTL
jgi:hypothetical protein